jgi:hypothetical protein
MTADELDSTLARGRLNRRRPTEQEFRIALGSAGFDDVEITEADPVHHRVGRHARKPGPQ